MGFDLPRVTKCCFCFPLRTGSLIIGYLSLFSCLVSISVTSYVIYLVSLIAAGKIAPPPGHTQQDAANEAIRLYILHAITILVQVFYFTISLLLVVGAHQNKPDYMRYYYITGMVNLILNLILVIVSFVFMGFFGAVTNLICCAIIFYFLLVVRSTYIDMEEATKPPAYEMRNYRPQQAPLMV